MSPSLHVNVELEDVREGTVGAATGEEPLDVPPPPFVVDGVRVMSTRVSAKTMNVFEFVK